MLFRGIVQNELQKHLKNGYIAIIVTALFFSLFHLDITGFFAKFFIGCVLGLSYYFTKNLLYPMILHFINNALLLSVSYLNKDSIKYTDTFEDQPIEVSHIVITLLSIPIMYLIFTNIKKQNTNLYGSSA
jgi:membrane protease YdiL (CAAX protease family)